MIKLRQLPGCFYKALVKTIAHDGIEHAGYLAFLSLLSLFPFLVFMFAVIGVIGQGAAGEAFINYLFRILPVNVGLALKPRIDEITSGPPQGLLTISILGAIWTASSAVEGIRTILNRAYHVESLPSYWLRRSLSIVQLLFFTFVIISGMVALVALQIFFEHLQNLLHIHLSVESLYYIRKALASMLIVVLFLAVSSIYYTVPNIPQRFLSVAPGAVVVVIGWIGFAILFTLYLLNFHQVNLIYGSLGGIIAALIFFYVCNMIFIFGAEFNHQIVETVKQTRKLENGSAATA